MVIEGLLNPALLELLARFRHTNTLVVADRGFPYWPQVQTVDLSLVDDIPTVRQVLAAILPRYRVGQAFMASEFLRENGTGVQDDYKRLLGGAELHWESHTVFKQRVPNAIGLIRTGDTTQYGNIILESA